MVGVPTLASPTYTMSRAIDHDRNGWLVRVDEWDEYLGRIVDEYETKGPAMGEAARQHARTAYAPPAMVGSILSALALGDAVPA